MRNGMSSESNQAIDSSTARTGGLPPGVVVGLVEDDPDQAAIITALLTEAGCRAVWFSNAREFRRRLGAESVDVLLLDWMLPDQSGLELLGWLRNSARQALPVIMLTVRRAEADIVAALQAGADDYLVKPYAFVELIARVEALSRRRETGSVATLLRVGELEMDLIGRSVRRQGKEIDLQPREFQLLEFLMRHAGQSVTRTMLLEKVWEYHFDPQTNVIDVHISRLRGKIDKGFDRPMLQTVRGAGYRLDA